MGVSCSRRAPSLRAAAARVVVLTELESRRAQVNWVRLVTCLFSIRKAQRIFAYTGHYLQLFKKRLRLRIALKWPQQ